MERYVSVVPFFVCLRVVIAHLIGAVQLLGVILVIIVVVCVVLADRLSRLGLVVARWCR